MAAIAIAGSFLTVWFIAVLLVCTMELYDGQNWIDAYRIGFLGKYCNEDDYFQFSKWKMKIRFNFPICIYKLEMQIENQIQFFNLHFKRSNSKKKNRN